MRLATFLFPLLLAALSAHAADEATDTARAALKVKIMEKTKLIAVMDIEGPSSEFKNDGDPNTLEVVFLSKKSDGPSRVSPDGEVVFLYKASDELQSKLIDQAFELRVTRQLSAESAAVKAN